MGQGYATTAKRTKEGKSLLHIDGVDIDVIQIGAYRPVLLKPVLGTSPTLISHIQFIRNRPYTLKKGIWGDSRL